MGRPRSLRHVVVWAALFTGLLPLGVIGLVGLLEARVAITHFERVLSADDRQTLAGAQFYLGAVLETARNRVERLASLEPFKRRLPSAQQELRRVQRLFPPSSFILALDNQDRPFAFVSQDRFLEARQVVRALPVLPPKRTGQAHYTRLFRLPNGEHAVALIYDYPEGFLVYGLDFAAYGEALARAAQGLASGILYMVSPDGRVIFETAPDHDLVGKDLRGLPFMKRLLAGESGSTRLEAGSLFPSGVVVTYAPVPVTGWGLMVATPVEMLEEPFVRLFYQALAVFLLSTLGVLVLAIRGTRSVGQLLDDHSQRLASLARGETPARAISTDLREFQEVDASFNKMAERIQADADERLRQLQQAQEALVRSERFAAMGQLAAVLAHEIKNRFNVIKLGSQTLETLLRDKGTNGELLELTQTISQAVDRGNDLMMSLLRFARPKQPRLEAYQLNDVVVRALSVIQQRNVQVQSSLQPDLPCLVGDPAEMEQVLINLLLNSLQAMPEGGAIVVTTRQVDGRVDVTVRDTGPGMEPATLEHLFEPFYTTKEGGTGLGMAIAKQFVESQGGQIAVDSALGHGTTVRISLPVSQASGGNTPISSKA